MLDQALRADLDFHRVIYKATGNELVNTIANFILDMITPWIRQSLEVAGPEKAAAMHQVEYLMIKAQNVGGARESFDMSPVDVGMEHWLQSLQNSLKRG